MLTTPLRRLLASALFLLGTPSIAGADSAPDLRIADYGVSFGPEAIRSAEGRGGDRSYLAQIQFSGSSSAKHLKPAPAPKTPQQDSQTVLADWERSQANSPENTQLALGRVIALESALWKRDQSRLAIAGNRFAAPVPEARIEYAAAEADVLYGPQTRPIATASSTLVGHCEIRSEIKSGQPFTLVRADAAQSTQSVPSRQSVTLPTQDPSAESC